MSAADTTTWPAVKKLTTRWNRLVHQVDLQRAILIFTNCRNRLFIVILLVVGGLWLLATAFSSSISQTSAYPEPTSEHPPSANTSGVSPGHAGRYPQTGIYAQKADSFIEVLEDVPRNQVVVRTVPTNEAGIGSVVAQLRSSAAIAAMLGASLATFSIISTHISQYRAASLLRLDLLETPLDAETKVCSLSTSPNNARTMELVNSWCNNVALGDAHALELRGLWSDCGLILDDRPWDVRYDMSKCTWKWVKQVFSKLGLKKRREGIGLHIRWGDMSISTPSNDPLRPERSTPIEKAAELLRKMRECGVQDELSVYMEWHNVTMLSGLGEPYRIVDTGDSIDDLLDLAANRVMILDISSWTVLAHQIAEGGLTIVPDIDLFSIDWYDNGVNRVLRWNELLSIPCSDLSSILSS
jgi:hypothetical protein